MTHYWYYNEHEVDSRTEPITYYHRREVAREATSSETGPEPEPEIVQRKIPAQYARPGVDFEGGFTGPPEAVLNIQLRNWKATEATIKAGGYDELLGVIIEYERRARVQEAARERFRRLHGESPAVETPDT